MPDDIREPLVAGIPEILAPGRFRTATDAEVVGRLFEEKSKIEEMEALGRRQVGRGLPPEEQERLARLAANVGRMILDMIDPVE